MCDNKEQLVTKFVVTEVKTGNEWTEWINSDHSPEALSEARRRAASATRAQVNHKGEFAYRVDMGSAT